MIAFLHFRDPGDADGFLSPHFRVAISYRGHAFGSATQLLACVEARFFGDIAAEGRIRLATSPKVVQVALRTMRRDATLAREWTGQRAREITYVQRLKFAQHPELGGRLRGTGDTLLCYSDPSDRVLGIGIADTNPNACRPDRWPGLNLLGQALTCVRAEIARRPARTEETAIAV